MLRFLVKDLMMITTKELFQVLHISQQQLWFQLGYS